MQDETLISTFSAICQVSKMAAWKNGTYGGLPLGLVALAVFFYLVGPARHSQNSNENSNIRLDGKNTTTSFSDFFAYYAEGPGIHKWEHYFPIYEKHFRKFIGRSRVQMVEVGVKSGGSMVMWTNVIGKGLSIVGIDIDEHTKVWDTLPGVKIVIGDQGSRDFWLGFKKEQGPVDIFIDDGSHEAEHILVTLQEMLPHIRPGGVYLIEDIHAGNRAMLDIIKGSPEFLGLLPDFNAGDCCRTSTNDIQGSIESVTIYPYVVVFEKRTEPLDHLAAPQHGSQWI